MIDDIHVGIQNVSIGGYEIITPKKFFSTWTSNPYRTMVIAEKSRPEPSVAAIEGKAGNVKTYDLIAKKALFRIFSGLQAESTEIIGFANQYGFLGEGFSTKLSTGEHVEPLSTWMFHIYKMRRAVELWDRIQKKDEKWLLDWLKDKDQQSPTAMINIESGNSRETIDSKGYKKTGPENSMSRYVELKARFNLMEIVNDELAGRVTAILLFKEDSISQRNMITANSLIGFMWLQLSLSIEDDFKYKKCVVCSKPFRVDPLRRGKPPRFCSDACKSKDYRDRKKGKTT